MKINILLLFLVLCLFGFTISACFKWAARAPDKLPKTTALNKTYNYQGKVIIVGAGASGLAAAKVLEQNNIDYKILEAADRYGERLKKNTTLPDFILAVSNSWRNFVPVSHKPMQGKEATLLVVSFILHHL